MNINWWITQTAVSLEFLQIPNPESCNPKHDSGDFFSKQQVPGTMSLTKNFTQIADQPSFLGFKQLAHSPAMLLPPAVQGFPLCSITTGDIVTTILVKWFIVGLKTWRPEVNCWVTPEVFFVLSCLYTTRMR